MIRVYKISLFACLLFLGTIFRSNAMGCVIYANNNQYIQLPGAALIQENTVPVPMQKNSLLFCRFHNGLDKSYISLFILCHETLSGLAIRNSLHRASHLVWCILSLHREWARYFDFSFSCSLRAPPCLSILNDSRSL